ncbi:MAG: hypothetical protein II873_00810 [Oscillospiraceae bacterium]|nr:hypothetical protein [Oscillospiraceae bacterium]
MTDGIGTLVGEFVPSAGSFLLHFEINWVILKVQKIQIKTGGSKHG